MNRFDMIQQDDNVISVICCDCQRVFFATKNSDCHIYNRCTVCCRKFDRLKTYDN